MSRLRCEEQIYVGHNVECNETIKVGTMIAPTLIPLVSWRLTGKGALWN